MKVGQKVKIINCDIHPEYLGKEGVVVKALRSQGGVNLYKVRCGRNVVPDYAEEDCLEPID